MPPFAFLATLDCMRLRTLGELRLEGQVKRRPKPLLLLAYLALEGKQARGHLAELFWPGSSDARNRLSVTLKRLRAETPGAFEADGDHVWTELRTDAQELMEALSRADTEGVRELYAGPFMDALDVPMGLEVEEWVFGTREHLADRVRQHCLERATSLAARGDFDRAAAAAEDAVQVRGATIPTADQLTLLADLLQAGAEDRSAGVRRLAAQEGIEIACAASAEAARTRLRAPDGATAADNNLPMARSSFVGRERELAGIAELLDRAGARIVTIHGHGGSGKSRLAVEVGRERLRAVGVDGVYLVRLTGVTSGEAILAAIAGTVGAPPQASRPLIERVAAALAGRQVVLILDDFEHLVEDASVLDDLMGASPELRMIVTSRRRLELEQEFVWQLGGLTVSGASGDESASDAVRLFTERARRTRADLVLGAQELPDVLEVCRQVEGSPLAIELAAVWVRSMSVSDIRTAITDSLDALGSPARNVASGHRTMRAVFDRSWGLLGRDQREALERLAVFRGGFSHEAATAVAEVTREALESLVRAAMLEPLGEDRYRQHALLQTYCRERLEASAEWLAESQARHLSVMRRLAQRASERLETREQARCLAELDLDLENLLAALDYAERNEGVVAVRLAVDLQLYWRVRQRQPEVTARLRRIIGSPALTQPTAERGWALLLIVTELPHESHSPRDLDKERLLQEGLTIAEATGDRKLLAALTREAALMARRRSPEEAEEQLLEALELFREIADTAGEADVLNDLGVEYYWRGDLASSKRWYEESLSLETRRGNTWGIASRCYNLGIIAKRLGQHSSALNLYRRSLGLSHSLGDRHASAYTIEGLACLASVSGAARRAATLWGAVEAERRNTSRHRSGVEQEHFEADVAEAREQVRAQEFDAAWAHGQREGLDVIVARELTEASAALGQVQVR